jgi:hypothetical protein
MGVVGQWQPRPFYPQERPGTRCIGGWVGLRASLVGCRKSRPHRDSTPDYPALAIRYTDWSQANFSQVGIQYTHIQLKGLQLKPDQLQHDPNAARVIAQQYFPATFH